jgi:hypothetical protein
MATSRSGYSNGGNPYGNPTVDFVGALGNIGDKIGAYRQQGAVNDALSDATGEDGNIDFGAAMAGALRAGDLKTAAALGTMADRKFNEQKDTRDFGFRQGQADLSQRNNERDFGFRQTQADRSQGNTDRDFTENVRRADRSYDLQDRQFNAGETRAERDFGLKKQEFDARFNGDIPPSGFRRNDAGLEPLPNGPADPAYIERVTKAKATEGTPTGYRPTDTGLEYIPGGPNDPEQVEKLARAKNAVTMTDAATEMKARQVINGDLSALTNVGKGVQGDQKLTAISNKAADILVNEMGMTPAEAASHVSQKLQAFKAAGVGQNAGARTEGTREANLDMILRVTDAAIPAALEQSAKVWRSGFVPLNKIIQRGQIMTSDPELRAFGMSNLQLAEGWARAMNPAGVMRESDRDKALEFLSTADSDPTYRRLVGQLRTQIERERNAVHAGRGGTTTPEPGAGVNDNGASSPKLGDVKIPMDAKNMLVNDKDPNARAKFDAIFGVGAAQRVLGPEK